MSINIKLDSCEDCKHYKVRLYIYPETHFGYDQVYKGICELNSGKTIKLFENPETEIKIPDWCMLRDVFKNLN